MLKNLGMSVFLCNFARYLLNTRYVCTRNVRSSHVHRTFIARTFMYKLRVNLVYCSCKHGAIIKESDN